MIGTFSHRRPAALLVAAAVLAAAVLVVLTATGGGHHASAAARRPSGARGHSLSHARLPVSAARPAFAPDTGQLPNIVFVLTDDLSMDLLRFMPTVQALERQGMTFHDYFVSDSLCCPSRASIFTGDFPHDTGVYTNTGARGGIGAFYNHDDEYRTFNVALQQSGYRTAMMGKYLNGYLEGPLRSPVPSTYVPPGWDQWDVAGWGYPEFHYTLNENGTLHRFGGAPADYLTDVIARKGVSFIDRSTASGSPFFLELATFAPHSPYTPAPRDAQDFPRLKAPRPPNFNRLPSNAPIWLSGHPPLTRGKLRRIDWAFRRRVQSVQAVDDMIGRIEAALQANGVQNDTYVVFSSDNGLHTGEYRLMPGKLTAFDTDIHVPLVVAGPGVPPDTASSAMTENVDLAETFAELGGTTLTGDGHSLVGLLQGESPSDWRNAILVEHHGPAYSTSDPDLQSPLSGNPPSYEAMRTKRFLYVEYDDGERELYDLEVDPYELHNIVDQLTPVQLDNLHAELLRLEDCHGPDACWAAGHVSATP